MKIHFRFIGDALAEWNRMNIDTIEFTTQIAPDTFRLHDLISHPAFQDRWLIVQFRHIDLAEPALTLYLDLLPACQPENIVGSNVVPLFQG